MVSPKGSKPAGTTSTPAGECSALALQHGLAVVFVRCPISDKPAFWRLLKRSVSPYLVNTIVRIKYSKPLHDAPYWLITTRSHLLLPALKALPTRLRVRPKASTPWHLRSHQGPKAPESRPLRVVCWNVQNIAKKRPEVESTLHSADATIGFLI